MSENALPPDEREAFEKWAVRTLCNPIDLQPNKRLTGYGNLELNMAWVGFQQGAAWARLAVQGGDAGQTDSVGATPAGSGSAASRPEPQSVSALRAPIPGAERERFKMLVQLPDGTYTRKSRDEMAPDDMVVFDGPDAFASTEAAAKRLNDEIEAAGGLDAWRVASTPECQRCHAPKSLNPHEQAGAPSLEFGYVWECIPCLVQTRSSAVSRMFKAEQRVAALEADARRLDWLERAGDVGIGIVVDAPHDGEYLVHSDIADPSYGKTLREAIDAALSPRQPEPGTGA